MRILRNEPLLYLLRIITVEIPLLITCNNSVQKASIWFRGAKRDVLKQCRIVFFALLAQVIGHIGPRFEGIAYIQGAY